MIAARASGAALLLAATLVAGPGLAGDAFTYSNPQAVRIRHAAFDWTADFDAKTLSGAATLDVERIDPEADILILDTDGLVVERVEAGAGDALSPAAFRLGEDDPDLGAPLEIALPEGADRVRVHYATDPQASGLQWLDPAQTAGGAAPYVYSQAQPTGARSFAPIQDTPAVRFTWEARLSTREDLFAVMAGAQDPDGARDGDYRFEMPQPIPSYLLALAIGDIAFAPIDERIGIYAEPSVIEDAVAEFEDTPAMMATASDLYGPYRWGRFDMLVLPPSFPYGGMENPRLTFLTPTLIAGDKSLVNVVAHELAHSWSGNLVTNAVWEDAWLNEGFTSYVENRIMEALFGSERATMERALDRTALETTVAALDSRLTRLALPDDIDDPGSAFSLVAYSKGMFFLKFLEERFGRAAFDGFLRRWFDANAFKAVTTEDFLAALRADLMAGDPDAVTEAEVEDWLYGEGLPDSLERPDSDRFENVDAYLAAWLEADGAPDAAPTEDWTAQEWLRFIGGLPGDMATDRLAALDAAFGFTGAANAEIACAWYLKAIPAGYEPAFASLADFLMTVGRGKFIYPLYTALRDSGRRAFADDVYAEARPRYHPMAQKRIDAILDGDG